MAKTRFDPDQIAEHVDAVCAGIAAGSSLRAICRERGIDESTARYYFSRDAEAMERFRAARELGCDALADEVLQIADTPQVGERIKVDADGNEEVTREDMLGHRRLQIDARLRLIGKWSQRYGDKVQHTGDGGGPIRTEGQTTIDISGLNDEQLRVLASIRIPT